MAFAFTNILASLLAVVRTGWELFDQPTLNLVRVGHAIFHPRDDAFHRRPTPAAARPSTLTLRQLAGYLDLVDPRKIDDFAPGYVKA